jgi:hypothetical protein
MNLENRISKLEVRNDPKPKPTLASVHYRQGQPIQYDGFTFESEAELLNYAEHVNRAILPVCIIPRQYQ